MKSLFRVKTSFDKVNGPFQKGSMYNKSVPHSDILANLSSSAVFNDSSERDSSNNMVFNDGTTPDTSNNIVFNDGLYR